MLSAAFVSVPASRMELLTRDIVPLIAQALTSFGQFQELLALESSLCLIARIRSQPCQPANGLGVNVYLVDRYS